MAMSAIWDSLEESEVYGLNGWNITRYVKVINIDSTYLPYQKVLAAFSYLNTNYSLDTGLQHPSFTSSYVTSVSPKMISTDAVEFQIQYEAMENFQDSYDLQASQAQIESNKDIDGEVISVTYTYPADYNLDDDLQGKTVTTSKIVSKTVPTSTLTLKRRQLFSSLTGPKALADTYVNKLNDGAWTWTTELSQTYTFATALEDGLWICKDIQGSYVQSVVKSGTRYYVYDMTYNFEKNEDGWTTNVCFIDSNTGEPPADLDTSSDKQISLYDKVSFNALTTNLQI